MLNLITMTQAEYARRLDVTTATITQWKQAGKIVMQGDRVDVVASDARLHTYRRGGMPPVTNSAPQARRGRPAARATEILPADAPAPEADSGLISEAAESAAERFVTQQGPMTFDQARCMKETYLAKLAQLEYDTKSGRVVEVDAVGRVVGQEYARVRNKLLALPSAQAARVHRCRSVAEVQDTLRSLITEALEELTADATKG